MSRRHKSEIGRVYKTNDSLFSTDGYQKSNRRVVVVENKQSTLKVRKIKTIKPGRKKLIEIEKYPDIRIRSGVDMGNSYSHTSKGKAIELQKMRKTKTRLNKWDRRKIGIK